MTKLMIEAMRIAVALMVMAAEIDVSMSVWIFEELTHTQPKPNGLFAVQMHSGLHILTGHLSGTLSTNEAKFKEELEGVFVEDITEQVLTVSSLPRLDRLQGSNQFGLNLEIVDPAAASTLRSPVLVIEQFMAASSSACEASIQEYLSIGQSSEMTVGENGAAVLDPIAED